MEASSWLELLRGGGLVMDEMQFILGSTLALNLRMLQQSLESSTSWSSNYVEA